MMATEPTPLTNTSNVTASNISRRPPAELDEALACIRDALRGLEYGQISVIVQDGVVIQIERTERKRLRRRPGK
ncbi:MAG TPA: YezD family protein [Pirellulales bacterium]|nr:YezD family protein [Pirellulales bacterium]